MATNDFYCDEVFSGKTKVVIVEETPSILAFHHTRPLYDVHIVLVPRVHIASLSELQNMDIVKEVFEIAKRTIMRMRLDETNFRIITNGGTFQDSKHLHFHLVSGKKREQ